MPDNNGRPNHIEDALVKMNTNQWFGWTDSNNKIYANLKLSEKVGVNGNVIFKNECYKKQVTDRHVLEFHSLQNFRPFFYKTFCKLYPVTIFWRLSFWHPLFL